MLGLTYGITANSKAVLAGPQRKACCTYPVGTWGLRYGIQTSQQEFRSRVTEEELEDWVACVHPGIMFL
jgi:hypothetical protein